MRRRGREEWGWEAMAEGVCAEGVGNERAVGKGRRSRACTVWRAPASEATATARPRIVRSRLRGPA